MLDHTSRKDQATQWLAFSGPALKLLDIIDYLARQQSKRSKTGAYYATPSRAWLAQRIGCSVRTVSRAIAELTAAGWLLRSQRRRIGGVYQTNLYRLAAAGRRGAARLHYLLKGVLHRGPRMAHKQDEITSRQEESAPRRGGAGPPAGFRDLINALRKG